MKRARKILKIAIRTLLSVIIVALIGCAVMIHWIVTPERLTPLVQEQLPRFLSTGSATVDEIELTFFSTFPQFKLRAKGVALVNQIDEATNDTVLFAQEIQMGVDLLAYLQRNELIINSATLLHPNLYLFTNSQGKSNFDLTIPSEEETDEDSSFENPFLAIDLEQLEIVKAKITYADATQKQSAQCADASLRMIGKIHQKEWLAESRGTLQLETSELLYSDSTLQIALHTPKLTIALDAKGDLIESEITFITEAIRTQIGSDVWVDNKPLDLSLQGVLTRSNQSIAIDRLQLKSGNMQVNLAGNAAGDPSKTMDINLNFEVDVKSIKELISYIPSPYRSAVKGINFEGEATLKGSAKGPLDSLQYPVVAATLIVDRLNGAMSQFPDYRINRGAANIDLNIDLNRREHSTIKIQKLSARVLESTIGVRGRITHIFADPQIDIDLTSKLSLDRLSKAFLAEKGYTAAGSALLKSTINTRLSALEKADLKKISLKGSIDYMNLTLNSAPDTLQANTPNGIARFDLRPGGVIDINLNTPSLKAKMGKHLDIDLQQIAVNAETLHLLDTTRIPQINCRYNIGEVKTVMDNNNLTMALCKGVAKLSPSRKNPKTPAYSLQFDAKQLAGNYEDNRLSVDSIAANLTVLHNPKEKEVSLQWTPLGILNIEGVSFRTGMLASTVNAPRLKLEMKPNEYTIHESRVVIDKSDFRLKGALSNIRPYLRGEGKLIGEFNFDSPHTDLVSLMRITSSQSGSEETAPPQNTKQIPVASTDDSGPFLVPTDVDVILHTKITEAQYYHSTIRNIEGDLFVRDGRLVLDELSCEMPGGKIALSAIYRTPRKNHLYMSIDYHMLDVQIHDLISMFPDLDTIVPMLRSFGGNGEFHAVFETNLDSLYNLKKSTLRGIASITGKDLILMDGETFSEIAKMLRFNKKQENKVDSLSADFSIYKNDLYVYPFELSMDKYKAVVSGKHNMNMTFDYHISVTDSPLPFKLGVDVGGSIDKMNFKLAPCKYAHLYKPEKRTLLEEEQISMRNKVRQFISKPLPIAP